MGDFVISLDFELFWGMLDVCALEEYRANVLGGRAAIPRMLALFEKYGIHATWATVGYLFAESKQELMAYFPPEDLRPGYGDPRLDPYAYLAAVGENEEEAPCFYAPSLIRRIAATPGQEIASHTFCHYYCREAGQTVQQFAADMAAARAIGAAKGYELTSVVLPRNQCEPEYTHVLQELGFTAFRDEENDWIHRRVHLRPLKRALRLLDGYLPLTGHGCFTPRREAGIWNITGSKMYKPAYRGLEALEGLKLRRIKAQMTYAAKHGLTYHLWWHPHNVGVNTDMYMAQLEQLLRHYTHLKETYGMKSRTMREIAERQEETPL